MVNECVKKNKNILIQEKISINIHDLELSVTQIVSGLFLF